MYSHWMQYGFGKHSGGAVLPGAPAINLDAHNIDGLHNSSLVDGQALSSWVDLGSLGLAFTQATGANQPAYRAVAAAGKLGNGPGVECVDTARFLTSSSFTPLSPPFMIAFIWRTTKVGTQVIFDARGPFITQVFTAAASTLHWAAGLSVDSGLNPSANTFHTCVIVVNDPSSEIRIDGVSTGAISLGASTFGAVITLLRDISTIGMVGFMEQFIVYPNVTVTPAQIEAFFTSYWGGAFPQ